MSTSEQRPTIVILLDPQVWNRGNVPLNEGGSLLGFDAQEQRKQCCIGCALTQLGVRDEILFRPSYADEFDEEGEEIHNEGLETSTLADIPEHHIPSVLRALNNAAVPEEIVDRTKAASHGTIDADMHTAASLCYAINDNKSLSDSTRVELLNEVSESVGLRFVLMGE
jgi:hypothetical protein